MLCPFLVVVWGGQLPQFPLSWHHPPLVFGLRGRRRVASADGVAGTAVGTGGKAKAAEQGWWWGGCTGTPCPLWGGGWSPLGVAGFGPRRGRGNEAFPGGGRACLCAELPACAPSPGPLRSIPAVSWSHSSLWDLFLRFLPSSEGSRPPPASVSPLLIGRRCPLVGRRGAWVDSGWLWGSKEGAGGALPTHRCPLPWGWECRGETEARQCMWHLGGRRGHRRLYVPAGSPSPRCRPLLGGEAPSPPFPPPPGVAICRHAKPLIPLLPGP